MSFFRSSFPIFFVTLLAAGGCSPSTPRETPSTSETTPETGEEPTIEDFIEMQLAQIRSQAGLPAEEKGAKTVRKWDESLREIEGLSDPAKRDRRYSDAVDQLIVENRFDEAETISGKIRDENIRDPLLEDIVRFRMQAALQAFQQLPAPDTPSATEGIQTLVRRATEVGRKIVDPFRRAEILGNIALFRWKIKDQTGALEAIGEVGVALRQMKDDDPRKAHGLHYITRRLLRRGENDPAYRYAKDTETTAGHLKNPREAATLLLDLSSIFTLLNKDDDARNACDEAAKFVRRIEPSKEKALALLKLAETSLVARMKEKNGSPAEKLLNAKKDVLEAAEIIAERPETVEPETTSEDELSFWDPHDHPGRLPVPDWNELTELKNKTLCNIAQMQVWGAPLEDVWETVLDIDEGPRRDDALVAAIEMLLTIDAWEDAEAWADEIGDPLKKREWTDNVKAAQTKNQ